MELRFALSRATKARTPFFLLGLRLRKSAIRFLLSPDWKFKATWEDVRSVGEGYLGHLNVGPLSVGCWLNASSVKKAQNTIDCQGWGSYYSY